MSIDLKSIISGTSLKPPKIVLYGVGGVGKTTWAAAAPKPIFIFTEEGQGILDLARFPICRTWADILACCKTLHEGEHDYQTVVIDTIDLAEPMLWEYVCTMHQQESIDTNGGSFGFGRGYGHAVNQGRELLKWLDVLRDDRGMAVIVIAHSDTTKFECPGLESYDRYGLRLHKKFAATVHDWADTVLFANFQSHVVKDDEGFKKTRNRAVGLGERILFTECRPSFIAKNRYGLPPQLPFKWAAFQKALTPKLKPKSK
jgi:hypothetical protein